MRTGQNKELLGKICVKCYYYLQFILETCIAVYWKICTVCSKRRYNYKRIYFNHTFLLTKKQSVSKICKSFIHKVHVVIF